jgi:hypothetical protein
MHSRFGYTDQKTEVTVTTKERDDLKTFHGQLHADCQWMTNVWIQTLEKLPTEGTKNS